MTRIKQTLLALVALASLSAAVMVGAHSPETADVIVPDAEAYDSCSPSTSGKYALRIMNTGNTSEPAYQSGPSCKLTICVPRQRVASKVGPPACSDAANPLCGFPAWILGYEVQSSSAPAGTPTCDAYWNNATRWAEPG